MFFRNSLKILVAIVVSRCIIHTFALLSDGLSDELHTADVILVLGNTVTVEGIPSPRLQSRLDTAMQLYRAGLAGHIFVSGGFGEEGFQEAKVMKKYLVEHDIPEQHILVDMEGDDTYHTAQNLAKVMQENERTSVLFVTHYYHILRTKVALHKFGIRETYGVHAQSGPERRDPYSILREIVAYYYYVWRTYEA